MAENIILQHLQTTATYRDQWKSVLCESITSTLHSVLNWLLMH